MSGSPIAGLPTPPPPGASTYRYDYPQFGDAHKEFMTVADPDSKSSGLADYWFNPLRWFGKQITYLNETRWFNSFRAERRPQHDRRSRGDVTRTGEFKVFRQGDLCWRAEKVRVDMELELAYDELQFFETWTINMTQESYYSFFTGYGGVMVDVGIDAPAAAAGLYSAKSVAAAAAAGTAPSAAAARLGVASRGLGLAGWGYLWFQVGTGAQVVWYGSTKNAAGDKIAEGWERVRTFWDNPIVEDTVEEWEAVEDPHPCTDAECEIAEQVALQPRTPTGSFLGVAQTRLLLAGGATTVVVLIAAFFTFRGGEAPPATAATATPTASASASAVASASATPAATASATPTQVAGVPAAVGATAGPGQVLVFRLDGVDYLPDGLTLTPPHPPHCSYEHFHGGPIASLMPVEGGRHLTRTEHLGECGYGPPNLFLIPDPR